MLLIYLSATSVFVDCAVQASASLSIAQQLNNARVLISNADRLLTEGEIFVNGTIDTMTVEELQLLEEFTSDSTVHAGDQRSANGMRSIAPLSIVFGEEAFLAPEMTREFTESGQLDEPEPVRASSFSNRLRGANDISRKYISGVSKYIWSGIGRVQDFVSTWTTPTTTPTTTTPSPSTVRRIRRAVASTKAPKTRPVSIEELHSLEKQRDKAKLSNLIRLYKIVKSKDAAKAKELIEHIKVIKFQMDARSYNRK